MKGTTHTGYNRVTIKASKYSKDKNKLSKQLEQEQNHRNGHHMEGYQWGRGEGNGGKIQSIRSINGR